MAVDAASIAITLLTLSWLLLACRKGLDVSDEGFYLLTAQYPNDVLMMTTSFHWVTSWLLWATGGDLVWVRAAGVLGTAAAAVCLGLALSAVAGARRSWIAVSSVTMGALLAYAWLLLTPSYNTYNGWAVLMATACVLRALVAAGRVPFDRRGWCAWMFGAGFCLTVSFFVKFPTAAAMGALVTISIVAWPGLALRVRAIAFVWIAVGVAVGTASMFLVIVSPLTWWRDMSVGLEQASRLDAGHGLPAIGRYARELRGHLGEGTTLAIWLLWAFGFVSATVLAATSSVSTRRAARVAIWLVLGAAALRSALELTAWLYPPALAAYTIRDPFPFWIARFHLHWLILMTAIAAGAGVGAWQSGPGPVSTPHSNRARAIVFLLLLGGTVAAAFGTANAIYINLMLQMGSWLALLVLAAHYASSRLDWYGAGDATILAILTFAAVQIVGGTRTEPYGMHAGLLRQTEPTSIASPVTQVLLDPETRRWIVELQQLAQKSGFRQGDDLLAFYNMPGVVYALGGRSPGLAWFTSGLRGSRTVNEMGLEAAGAARVSRAFILQTPESDAWLRTLSPLGIDFPARYEYCGTVIRRHRGLVFELKLWRPASLPAR